MVALRTIHTHCATLQGYFGWSCTHIRHLRLGFYQGNIFTEEPTVKRDVEPINALLEEVCHAAPRVPPPHIG